MEELLRVICEDDRLRVIGRELHHFLQVNTPYTQWFERMCGYGFVEGFDWIGFSQKSEKPRGGRPTQEHRISIDMAKELCMLQRTERGKQARQYFLELERQWNSPEAVLARALKLHQKSVQINDLMRLYQAKQERLALENESLREKGRYYDALVDSHLLTTFRDTAKEFGVSERALVRLLLDTKRLYRDPRGRLMPYAPNDKKLFQVKEQYNEETGYVGIRTFVTPEGRAALLELSERYLKGGVAIGS